MSDEINVIQRTQIINVEPESGSVSIMSAGPPGPSGIPSGGTTGQVLRKKSNSDFDVEWVTPT